MAVTPKQIDKAVKALAAAYKALGPIVMKIEDETHGVIRLRRDIAEYESYLDKVRDAEW